jgi:predicted nucleotidyltransferase/HEPN domain-containing protein
MVMTRRSRFPFPPQRDYTGTHIPMRVIRRYARAIAERFQPDKIILFGSYAYGTPHEASDVDILVIMPARDEREQSLKIRYALPPPFPMDLIVRTPKELQWRLAGGDSFLREIVSKGKSLHANRQGGGASPTGPSNEDQPRRDDLARRLVEDWARKAEGEFTAASLAAGLSAPSHAHVCFHCRQATELYLKALVQMIGSPVPRTDGPLALLPLLLPSFPDLGSLRRGLAFLGRFTVGLSYPGHTVRKRESAAALRWAGRVRTVSRALLRLTPRRQSAGRRSPPRRTRSHPTSRR